MTFHLHGADLVETATLTAGDLLKSQVIAGFTIAVESLFNDVL